MGQFLPSIRVHGNNDDLVSALVKNQFIISKKLEEVFRCVDRGFFFPKDNKTLAYCDSILVSDAINLSSPTIYASVLEGLKLQKGHRFLCVGSGIGYLNTVAGLLLDVNGVNHGIEVNHLKYSQALQKVEEFKLNAAAIDYYNFCEPVFIHGNACELLSPSYYDRIYCGVDVPPEEYEFFKSLIAIGGVLVLPFDGFLLQVTRKDEYGWATDVLEELEVSFSDLVVPSKNSFNVVKFPSVEPLSLQELCRSSIRTFLLENIKEQFPDLSIDTKLGSTFNLTIEAYKDDASPPRSPLSDVSTASVIVIDDSDEEENEENKSKTEKNILLGQHLPHLTSSETSDKSTKRKFPEAGSSKQNETVTEVENSKKIKMDSSSQKPESTPVTYSISDTDSWENAVSLPSSSSSYNDSEDLDSSNGNNFEEGMIVHHPLADVYFGEQSETESESEEDSVNCRFMNEYKRNKLSNLLKMKIDVLPIPVSLKNFLNYYRSY